MASVCALKTYCAETTGRESNRTPEDDTLDDTPGYRGEIAIYRLID